MIFPMQNRLRGSGHGIAATRMDAKLNAAGWIAEQMGGVRYDSILYSYGVIHCSLRKS
jgi:Zn-dependent M16 (insulinase) family peptidase